MLTNSSSQPLLAQFQARYPTASLIADLLTIHHDSYVVRAVVQIGGTLLATGMASASDIEQAEDRAKVRALAALGIETFNPAPLQSVPSSYAPLPLTSVLEQAELSDLPAMAIPPEKPSVATPNRVNAKVPEHPPTAASLSLASEAAPSPTVEQFNSFDRSESPSRFDEPISTLINSPIQEPIQEPISPPVQESIDTAPNATPESEFTYDPDILSYPLPEESTLTAAPLPFDTPLPLDATLEIQPPAVEPSPSPAKGKATKRKSEPASPPPAPAASSSENDRSEEIAKIGVEMKRLGWTTDQGKNYLKRTYGKRSRQELSDDELIDFLRYLENQPSPTESLF